MSFLCESLDGLLSLFGDTLSDLLMSSSIQHLHEISPLPCTIKCRVSAQSHWRTRRELTSISWCRRCVRRVNLTGKFTGRSNLTWPQLRRLMVWFLASSQPPQERQGSQRMHWKWEIHCTPRLRCCMVMLSPQPRTCPTSITHAPRPSPLPSLAVSSRTQD